MGANPHSAQLSCERLKAWGATEVPPRAPRARRDPAGGRRRPASARAGATVSVTGCTDRRPARDEFTGSLGHCLSRVTQSEPLRVAHGEPVWET